ncbi:transcription repressor NadR [Alkalihalobacillus sp. 1P02AB]|uniref:transcription repressor NadR n=1 Tax=Alkalihalobacillus sp. 1P02AB TaxID=3132260 RepID=UPI0039A47BE7
METHKKLLGEARRKMILQWLQSANGPLTGTDLSKKTNVSRQVIVQDISILKAKNHPIIATAQGYVYHQNLMPQLHSRIIACFHTPEQTMEELNLIVDHGVSVKDVIIEHPIYGEITAYLRLSNRQDVKDFCQHVSDTNAPLLSKLTNGVHLHTIEAPSVEAIDKAVQALEQQGFLLNEKL